MGLIGHRGRVANEITRRAKTGETEMNSFGSATKSETFGETKWANEPGADGTRSMDIGRHGWQTCLVIYQSRPLVIYSPA